MTFKGSTSVAPSLAYRRASIRRSLAESAHDAKMQLTPEGQEGPPSIGLDSAKLGHTLRSFQEVVTSPTAALSIAKTCQYAQHCRPVLYEGKSLFGNALGTHLRRQRPGAGRKTLPVLRKHSGDSGSALGAHLPREGSEGATCTQPAANMEPSSSSVNYNRSSARRQKLLSMHKRAHLCLVSAVANLAVPSGPSCLGSAMPGGRPGRGVMVCIWSRAASLSPSATSICDSSSMIPSAVFSNSSPYQHERIESTCFDPH